MLCHNMCQCYTFPHSRLGRNKCFIWAFHSELDCQYISLHLGPKNDQNGPFGTMSETNTFGEFFQRTDHKKDNDQDKYKEKDKDHEKDKYILRTPSQRDPGDL